MNFQRVFAVGSAVAAPVGLFVVYAYPPTSGGFYPPCFLHYMTGLHCPGCGMTRCVHALLHGDIAQAFAYNSLFILLLPLIIHTGYRIWFACLTNRPLPPDRTPRWVVYVLCGIVLLFGVLRNLPFEPFKLLAPHEL